MNAADIYPLGNVIISIPAGQVAFFLATLSIFMLRGQRKMCLIITYLFTFYLGFLVYGHEFIGAAQGSNLALSFYLICGMVHLALTLVSFFQES